VLCGVLFCLTKHSTVRNSPAQLCSPWTHIWMKSGTWCSQIPGDMLLRHRRTSRVLFGVWRSVTQIYFKNPGHDHANRPFLTTIKQTMKPLHVLNGHTEPVSFVAWSADDTYLLTCGNDHALKLWNTNTGTLMQTFKKHTEPVTSCAWLPSGVEFVSGGMDKSVYLWVWLELYSAAI
jgi:WD40 repeat protein